MHPTFISWGQKAEFDQAGSKGLAMPGQRELVSIENLTALPNGVVDDTVRGAAKYCQIGHHAAEALLLALTDALLTSDHELCRRAGKEIQIQPCDILRKAWT